MVGIVLASHGGFADGIFQSAEMIFGPQQNLAHVILKPDEGPDDIHKKMEDAVASFDDQEQVLFIVDLWGGTPFNQANDLVGKHKDTWAIVSGMNLPMVIEALGQRLASDNAHEIAKGIVKPGKDGIKTIPEDLMPKEAPKAEAKKAPEKSQSKGAIAPGTVLGDGHIKHVLARVDTRLLHGQVATGWTKTTNPNRIIVVSDKVSKDNLRKNMIKQAAPAGVHAHVVPLKKMVEVEKDPRFGDTRALLLFETVEDALAAVKAGVPLKEINLGSSAYKDGKVNVTKALSFDQQDIDAIKELEKMGVKFDVRGVPGDKPADINELVDKAEKLLAEKKN
ncbi:PTS sugar transporter subunit IIB [Lactobacillus hominis]|uniref:PTS system mannose-specific EIIAB component n=1 Tax=Lactobacillus hominis DSM 23910 = CRBIP 24.179 TaxID=1423758 RepID=I7LA99_9LACO|nr:PTS sugar transporter subunit IIB [Lactobacillus hominis]KRM84304.1 protein-N(pi)-phosphohistidine--sugar phosphotransferase [Lactobacillus hominis DSM 23910 = CRBIP 24.179]MCT3348424.1 PTS mannose transporter subunit IIAB [Lactobacillus hominis]CCI82079.1 Phosphoenolpyruvate-dependent sugar phosphotransferase system EIIAB, probably mannose specific [Lactobacillus hominis DSM 23910 = CRBIP 24.179]